MNTDDANYLGSVRDQYEQYPYPERNPEDEKRFHVDKESNIIVIHKGYQFS